MELQTLKQVQLLEMIDQVGISLYSAKWVP